MTVPFSGCHLCQPDILLTGDKDFLESGLQYSKIVTLQTLYNDVM